MILLLFPEYYYFNIGENLIHEVKVLIQKAEFIYFGIIKKDLIEKIGATEIYIITENKIEKEVSMNFENDITCRSEELILEVRSFHDIFFLPELRNIIKNHYDPIIFKKFKKEIQTFNFSCINDHELVHKDLFSSIDSNSKSYILNLFLNEKKFFP